MPTSLLKEGEQMNVQLKEKLQSVRTREGVLSYNSLHNAVSFNLATIHGAGWHRSHDSPNLRTNLGSLAFFVPRSQHTAFKLHKGDNGLIKSPSYFCLHA